MALEPGRASRVQILDSSLLCALLSKSGADGWCPGERRTETEQGAKRKAAGKERRY